MIDSAVAELASTQHGLVSLGQLQELGVSRSALRRRLESGRWRRLHREVFALAGCPESWEQSVLGAVLAGGEGAVASHTTAGELWGFRYAGRGQIEILTPRPECVRRPGVSAHRSIALDAADVGVCRSIRVTTPARTLIDLTGCRSLGQIARDLDGALRRDLLTLSSLRSCVERVAPAPGRRPSVIRRLLAERQPGYDPGESGLELKVLDAIAGAGLPAPVLQHRVRFGARRYRIDLAYPDERIAVEVDGYEPHRSVSSFHDDRARANDLVAAGWTLLRFTSRSSDRSIAETVRVTLRHLGGLARRRAG